MAQRICTVEGCGKKHFGKGWCGMHYYRWYRYGDVHRIGRVVYGPAEKRFWSKVDKNGPIPEYRPELGPCWLWTGATNAAGYGIFGVDSKSVLAHRWGFLEFVEETELPLDHLCRNHRCVNYECHLQPVTNVENTARSPIHYGARTQCSNGHEFIPDNTLRRSDGGRRCLACKRMWGQKTRERKRSA